MDWLSVLDGLGDIGWKQRAESTNKRQPKLDFASEASSPLQWVQDSSPITDRHKLSQMDTDRQTS